MKRSLDVLLSLAAIAILAPLLLVTAALVRLTSSGPALFRQKRVGLNGVPFTILKFRTMASGSLDSDPGLQVTSNSDPRITRLGHLLRSTKIDELPQLINVVRGDMSLVGPRPEVPRYVDCWSIHERAVVLSVRPGITDPASIEFRDESSLLASQSDPDQYYREEILPLKLALYMDYVETRSLQKDLRVLVATIRSVARA